VVRVIAAYLVGAWLLAQVADLVLPNLGAPSWVMPLMIRLLALGLPVAFFLAWAFEITPQGIKRHNAADSQDSGKSGLRRLDVATLVGVAIIVVIVGYQQFQNVSSGTRSVSAAAASIAVLAFENLSPDPSNAYFAEGISEEILNVLAGINGLRVASRTSAFSFAGRDASVPEIGSLLDVRHVLEGSVRKQGKDVRITAQLIDAETDTHLWSKTYDRKLIDIFKVQEEIALAITDALMGTLGMRQVAVDQLTADLEAYEMFLEARTLFYERDVEAMERAISILEGVVERDSEFAEAWSLLGATLAVSRGYSQFGDEEVERRTRAAGEAAARALALDLQQAMAVAVQAQVLDDNQVLRSIELTDQAARMAPNDAGLQMWAGNQRLIAGGYLEETLPLLQRAYTLDPLVGINNGMLGCAYLAAGKRELGYQHIRRATELGWPHAQPLMIVNQLRLGDVDGAAKSVRAMFPEGDPESWDWFTRNSFSVEDRVVRGKLTADGLAEIEASVEAGGTQLFLAWHYMALGDIDRMFGEAFSTPEFYDLFFRLAFSPAGRAVVEDPRFIELGQQHHLLPVWQTKGYPMDCVRIQDEIGDHLSCPSWPE